MALRRFDDKATWRTAEQWGTDAITEAVRSERVFDPNSTVTTDPTTGGIGGLPALNKITKMTGTLYTGLNDDPSQMVNKAYK